MPFRRRNSLSQSQLILKRVPAMLRATYPDELPHLRQKLLDLCRRVGIAGESIESPVRWARRELYNNGNELMSLDELKERALSAGVFAGLSGRQLSAARCQIDALVSAAHLQCLYDGSVNLTPKGIQMVEAEIVEAEYEKDKLLCESCRLLGNRIHIFCRGKACEPFRKELDEIHAEYLRKAQMDTRPIMSVRTWTIWYFSSQNNAPHSVLQLIVALEQSGALSGITGRTAQAARTEWNSLVRNNILRWTQDDLLCLTKKFYAGPATAA